jgi:hypothetical protein
MGPALPAATFIMFLASAIKLLPEGVSWVVVVVLGVMLFIAGGLAWLIFARLVTLHEKLIEPVGQGRVPVRPGPVDWASIALLWVCLIVFLFMLVFLATSLFFAWPQDLTPILKQFGGVR